MSKRGFDERQDQPYKRHKHDDRQQYNAPSRSRYEEAAARLPPSTSPKTYVPAFVPFKVSKGLPDLPELPPQLAEAPFRHKSTYGYDRTSTAGDMTYERLEFIGDAYLEVIASRLIFHHYPQLTAGGQSQVRELLVKNETLAEYAKAYGFENRLNIQDKEGMMKDARNRGNKGMNKILGDSFEAYVAAVILGDAEHGFAIAEKWLTTLWASKLLDSTQSHLSTSAQLIQDGSDRTKTYDPTAKATLQQKLLTGGIKLDYEPYRDSIELKGDKLGQNRHFIAIYLTGYGYTRQLLGQGEGKNKVEAGNWAAVQAMHGEQKRLVEECAAQLAVIREEKKKLKAEQESQQQNQAVSQM